MSKNTQSNDLKTLAYVLRRTNYGESDRILNVITPNGKYSAIAKGVRKEKSKLAGGIELFSLVELVIHQGKSEMGVVTSAKMIRYYDNIVKDYARTELGALILKKISVVADSSDSPEYFSIVDQSLFGLNAGYSLELVEAWFLLNISKLLGEEINLYWDKNGVKLSREKRYDYDVMERSMEENKDGKFGEDEIKMLRLMMTAKLELSARVKGASLMLPRILQLARMISGAV